MKSILTAALLVLLLGHTAMAQVKGTVVNAFTKQPLPDVQVAIENSTYAATTDEQGGYSIEYFPGDFVVNYNKSGFSPASVNLKLGVQGTYPAATVAMAPIPPRDTLSCVGKDGTYFQLAACKTSKSTARPTGLNPLGGQEGSVGLSGRYSILPHKSPSSFFLRNTDIFEADGKRPRVDYALFKISKTDKKYPYLTVDGGAFVLIYYNSILYTYNPVDEDFWKIPGVADGLERKPHSPLAPGFYAFIRCYNWGMGENTPDIEDATIYVFAISTNSADHFTTREMGRGGVANALSDTTVGLSPLMGTWKASYRGMVGLFKRAVVKQHLTITDISRLEMIEYIGESTVTNYYTNVVVKGETLKAERKTDKGAMVYLAFSMYDNEDTATLELTSRSISEARDIHLMHRVKADGKSASPAP